MHLPTTVKEFFENATLVIGVIAGIIPFTKSGREWIKKLYSKHKARKIARNGMPAMLTSIGEIIKSMDDRLKKVEYDMTPNSGTTIKGLLKLIKAEIDVTNWLSPRPTFRTTSTGINVSVNEAFCHLCGVTSDELLKLGWKNFAADEEQCDEYYLRFRTSTRELSQFSGKLKIQTSSGEYRGEWLIRVRPLGPIEDDMSEKEINYLWSGCLYPFDDAAKVYAKHANIPLFI